MMSDLPNSHIFPSPAFMRCGVDYTGPFQIKIIQVRGSKSFKAYTALWVYFTTRAIPLELDLEPFLETGSAGRRPGQGHRRATTPNEDHYLVLTARRHRNMNATLLQQHLRSAIGTMVSTQTVRNRLHGVGLYARRPMVCVRLTSSHRRDCRDWATKPVNWRRNE
ncbi:transposable element Tcb2 transposase [Trichonephila clavipes]|nr:transposable element Tcb2 transposase [Trichonephila clavipes]